MKLPIRVFIVEDQPLVRRGVLAILEEAEGIEAVGAADDGAEVLAATGRLRPDIVFLDLQRADAFEMIRTLLTHYPEVRIVALSDGDGDARALAAVRAGVYGYVSRSEPASELIRSIRQVHGGDPALPSAGMRGLIAGLQSQHDEEEPTEPLSPREAEVLALLARGLSNREIAVRLNIVEATVRTHVSHILDKLGAANRVAAALHALRMGVAPLEHRNKE
jgi:DNA-binding NarL/FixJ family response regulator